MPMLTRRTLAKILATTGAGLSSIVGCAYDPYGSRSRESRIHAPWLIDQDNVLLTLEGGAEEPAAPVVWNVAEGRGRRFLSPESDKWHSITTSRDGAWFVGTVHELDPAVGLWPNYRNRIAMFRADGSGYRKLGQADAYRTKPLFDPQGERIWYTKGVRGSARDPERPSAFDLFSMDPRTGEERRHTQLSISELYVCGFGDGGVWLQYYASMPPDEIVSQDHDSQEISTFKDSWHYGILWIDVAGDRKPRVKKIIGSRILVSGGVFVLDDRVVLRGMVSHATGTGGGRHDYDMFAGTMNSLEAVTSLEAYFTKSSCGYGLPYAFLEWTLQKGESVFRQALLDMATKQLRDVSIPEGRLSYEPVRLTAPVLAKA